MSSRARLPSRATSAKRFVCRLSHGIRKHVLVTLLLTEEFASEIGPARVHSFYQGELFFPSPIFVLLLACDRKPDVFIVFEVYEATHFVLAGEASKRARAMLFHAPIQIAPHAYIQCVGSIAHPGGKLSPTEERQLRRPPSLAKNSERREWTRNQPAAAVAVCAGAALPFPVSGSR
jgi:hypothetical protein